MKKGILILLSLIMICSLLAVEKKGKTLPSRLGRKTAIKTQNRDIYLQEGFEGAFPPTGWELSSIDEASNWVQNDGTTYGSGAAFEGSFSAMFDNWNYPAASFGSLTTPVFDLSGVTNPMVKFFWWNDDAEDSPAQLNVSTSTNGTDFTEIAAIDVFGCVENNWAEFSTVIDNSVTHIRLTGVSDYGYANTFVDQFTIEDGPTTPVAFLNFAEVNFLEVPAGASSNPFGDMFTLSNSGIGTLTIDSITDLSATEFSTTFDQSVELGIGESHSFGFTYSPIDDGEDVQTFEIVTNGGTVNITLTGLGVILAEGMIQIGSEYEVTQSVPCEPAWQYTYSQSLFNQEEINIADKQLETIYYKFNGNSAFTDEVDIYMGHTDQAELSSWIPLEELTLVYSGPVTTTQTEICWVEIDLDIPFLYNNIDNLVIAYDENSLGNHSYDDDFYCTLTPSVMSVVEYNNNNDVDPANPEATYLVSSRPNMRMQFADISSQEFGSIMGSVTAASSGEALVGATISAGVFETETEVDGSYYLEVIAGTYNLTISAEGYLDYTVEDLEVAVDAIVDLNAALYDFFTLVDEGFEGGACPPAGWSHYQMGETTGWSVWEFEHNGSYAARHYATASNSDDWLVSPQLSINGSSELSYWSWLAQPGCTILISTGSGDPADEEFQLVQSLPELGMGWNNYSIDLSEYAGSAIYIAFRGQNASEVHDWTIDDILVTDAFASGTISGNVSLNGGSGNVEEVLITAGGHTTTPDASGDYELAVAAGSYEITASLMGYSAEALYEITVVSGEITSDIDFSLNLASYNPAQNVTLDAESGIMSWDIPVLPENQQELIYDDGSPSWAISEMGTLFGNRLTPEAPCQILSLKYFTYCDVDTVAFDAKILGWNGSTPTEEILFQSINVPAEMGNWTEVDLSEYNLMVEGDFVACMQPWMPVALFVDEDGGNDRAWRGFTQDWSLQGQTYFIRATVQYEDGRISEIGEDKTREVIYYNVFLDDMNNPLETISWEEWEFEGLENGQSYTAGVQAVYEGGTSDIVTVDFTYTGTAVDENEVPLSTSLKGNYPNPFNPETTIRFFTNDQNIKTELQVYNMRGQKIKTLINEVLPSGSHAVTWKGNDDNGRKVASGIYMYKMKSGSYSSTRKMILLK